LLQARQINPEAKLYGIDIDSERARALEFKGINAHCLDIEFDKLPFPDCSIDVVIANQILEHTKEIFWICHEISRVLSVDAKLILGVPNLCALHNRILLFLGRQPSCLKTNSAHVRGFTKDDLLRFLNAGFPRGYQNLGFRGSNFYPFPPVVSKLLSRCFPTMATSIFLLLVKRSKYKSQFLEIVLTSHLETAFYLGPNEK
jgi:hypothetical protein